MLKNLKELYTLLNVKQRRKLLRLQILIVLMAFAEVAGVMSIGPFMALVSDMDQLQEGGMLTTVFSATGLESPEQFLFWLGCAVFTALLLATALSMYTIWQLSLYGSRVGAELASRLFTHYLHKPWLFHAAGSSSDLTSRISQECHRITTHIIKPLMYMNARLVMLLFMSAAMFIYNPKVAAGGLLVFLLSYFLLYYTVRRRLVRNGRRISESQAMRFKLMAEGFGGIKDVLLLGRQRTIAERFEASSLRYAKALGVNQGLAQLPRYAMELVAFGSVIFLVLYLLLQNQANVNSVLPVLAVFALAGLKLLPAFQQVYTSVSEIRGNLSAFEAVREELHASSALTPDLDGPDSPAVPPLTLRHGIQFDKVSFSYDGERQALDGLSLYIPVNRVVGLVGPSGCGKSTAIDLLLGLIDPQSGQVCVDGVPLSDENRRSWQNSLGFVSQSIFLTDASIRENIAFALPNEEIDEQRVRQAATLAHLDELLVLLPESLDTRVGERGVQLSGGQRQRIGIARALYHDARVLVFDEATSALDGITEKIIMDAIHDFSGSRTVVLIAHRIKTVEKCDLIYLMKDGRVIDQGAYDDLIYNNEMFKRMASHA